MKTMKLNILDPHVSIITNVFIIIANICGLIYNIPQLYKTYKTKDTKSFSTTSMILRCITCSIWTGYGFEIESLPVAVNNMIPTISSIFILYYMIKYPKTAFFIKLHNKIFRNKSVIYTNLDSVMIDTETNINNCNDCNDSNNSNSNSNKEEEIIFTNNKILYRRNSTTSTTSTT